MVYNPLKYIFTHNQTDTILYRSDKKLTAYSALR